VKNDQLHVIQAAVSRFLKAIDKTEKVQDYSTLGQVYYNLSYPQKSLESAQLSLTFVNASK
jgi:arginine repressor